MIRKDGSHGFVLSKGKFTTIDIPGSTFTDSNGINARGVIVGRQFTDGVSHGYVLEDNVLAEVAFPGASRTFTFAINDRGDTVGAYDDNLVGGNDGTMHSFFLDKN